jgi:hypothetical protein
MLNYNPKQFFGAGTSIRQVFDYAEMRRWLDRLTDAEQSGLPKKMVRIIQCKCNNNGVKN